jgi:hypothetical protein
MWGRQCCLPSAVFDRFFHTFSRARLRTGFGAATVRERVAMLFRDECLGHTQRFRQLTEQQKPARVYADIL